MIQMKTPYVVILNLISIICKKSLVNIENSTFLFVKLRFKSLFSDCKRVRTICDTFRSIMIHSLNF